MTDHSVLMNNPFLATVITAWDVLWPVLLIAVLRIGDVTLNVFRTVFTVEGRKGLASLFHGLEAGVWLGAAGIVFSDVSPERMAGYVLGVLAGTYLGTSIIERLQMGTVTVRIYLGVPPYDPLEEQPATGMDIAGAIHDAGFGATRFAGTGYKGPVEMVLSTVRRKDAATVTEIATGLREDALVAVDNDFQAITTSARV